MSQLSVPLLPWTRQMESEQERFTHTMDLLELEVAGLEQHEDLALVERVSKVVGEIADRITEAEDKCECPPAARHRYPCCRGTLLYLHGAIVRFRCPPAPTPTRSPSPATSILPSIHPSTQTRNP